MDNPLELVPDDFTQEEHDKFNADILGIVAGDSKEDRAMQTLVLAEVVAQLGNRAAPKYHRVTEIRKLMENESIQNMVQKGLVDFKLNDARRLKILRKDQLVFQNLSNETPAHKPSKVSCESTGSAELAWTCQYRGNYHRTMLNIINTLERNREVANCIPLIQSSGSGKSRLVDEMAKLVFTIPMNIRDPAERYGRPFPPEDGNIWQYLCGQILKRDEAIASTALFFKNLFAQVTIAVERVFFGKRELSPGELAAEWRKHLSDSRHACRVQLYGDVIAACRDADTCSAEALQQQLVQQTRLLLDTLKNFCRFPSATDVRIVLYFDEAHELDKRIPNDETTLYDILRSTLCWFRSAHVFTVFISTTPSLFFQKGPSEISARKLLAPPFTTTPFDCHPSFPLGLGYYGLADVVELQFLARFGRPLFWTMLENDRLARITPALLNDMMGLARAKLLFDHAIDKPERHSPVAQLAILDVSITIDYEPMSALARQLRMDMVESHMRTAFSVPHDHAYLFSGYPSEPFMAEAASRQMHCSIKGPFNPVTILKTNLTNGVIDAGRKGEMVMRLLLREAYINAVVAEQDVKGNSGPNFSRGCTLVDFLKALFAERFHDLILQCQPDNKVAFLCTLEDTFKDAIVRFTHFVRPADGSSITTRGMAMGFLRGAAFMCHNVPLGDHVDVAIPILLNRDAKIMEKSMSALLVHVKWGCNQDFFGPGVIEASRLDFFPEAPNDTRPYVTLVSKLGIGASPSETYDGQWARDPPDPMHPRYSICTYECTPKAFNVISSWECSHYADLLADHPRLDNERMRRMMPLMYSNPAWCPDVGQRPVKRQHAPVEVGVCDGEEEEPWVQRLSRHLDTASDLAALSPLTESDESGTEDNMAVDEKGCARAAKVF